MKRGEHNGKAVHPLKSYQLLYCIPNGSDIVQHHENENKPLTYACFFVRRPNYYRIREVKPHVPVIQYSPA
jgi:hypothetical protein